MGKGEDRVLEKGGRSSHFVKGRVKACYTPLLSLYPSQRRQPFRGKVQGEGSITSYRGRRESK